MNRTLALTICLGLASSLIADAKPKDKEEKKQRHQQGKVAKAEAKFEQRSLRAAGRGGQGRPVQNFAPRVLPQSSDIRPELNRAIDVEARRDRPAIERRGPSNYSWSYDEARRFHHRGVRRDRSWYQSNYSRFALFAGGYYYFDRGYWYPAYGYDPAYTDYRFDEPIYGYNSLEPGEVLVNVQQELRRQGYYRGSIDGLIGPMTRTALERYQRENGLYVTRAVDGPTLSALGLT